jgi:exosortase B
MAHRFDMNLAKNAAPPSWLVWWPVALGLLVLYLPTGYDMAHTVWNTEDQAHGPMVVCVSMWLLWNQRQALLDTNGEPRLLAGGALMVMGLLLYVLGRSQSVVLLELGSPIPVVGGIVLATRGVRAVRAMAFPLLFLIFSAPLPGVLLDALTGSLKQHVSVIAEQALYVAGYPVARNGVSIAIGQYQLLVADACSGLHSLFSLSAVGLLYVHLMAYRSRVHNGLLLASVLPIAFFANVIRVIVLVLVTYYFGEETAQGFIHGFAGLAMFVIALSALFLLDGLFRWFIAGFLGRALR